MAYRRSEISYKAVTCKYRSVWNLFETIALVKVFLKLKWVSIDEEEGNFCVRVDITV